METYTGNNIKEMVEVIKKGHEPIIRLIFWDSEQTKILQIGEFLRENAFLKAGNLAGHVRKFINQIWTAAPSARCEIHKF